MLTKPPAECPLCGKDSAPAFTPFCSKGCRSRDMLNWLGDAYRVPVNLSDDEASAQARDGLDSDR